MNNNEIEEYLQKGEYAGIVEGNYDFYCPLKLEEINNFVQNVGIYTNIAIIRGTDEDEDVLFNTYGTYINRIWPELSLSIDKDETVQELNTGFERWDILYNYGGNDPMWSDGVNLNLVRNHIIAYKKRIEETFSKEEYPDIYYRDTPLEVNDDYMANPNEIKATAKQVIDSWKGYFYLDELKSANYYLDKYQLVETGIQQAVNRINVLETAIQDDDLVTMRRLNNYGEQQFEDMKTAFEKLQEINREEEHQIFFAEILQ